MSRGTKTPTMESRDSRFVVVVGGGGGGGGVIVCCYCFLLIFLFFFYFPFFLFPSFRSFRTKTPTLEAQDR